MYHILAGLGTGCPVRGGEMKYFTSAWNSDIKNFVAKDPSEITIRFICGGDMGRVHIFYDKINKNAEEDRKK
jgi:hypothetical protein